MLEGAGAFSVSHSSCPRCPWRSYKELFLPLIFEGGEGDPYDLVIYPSSEKQHNLVNFLAQQHYIWLVVLNGPSHAENTRPCLCPYMGLDFFFFKATFFNPISSKHWQEGLNQGLVGNLQILLLLTHTDPIITAWKSLLAFGHHKRHPLLVVEPRKEHIGVELMKHLFILSSVTQGTCQGKCISLIFITVRRTRISRQQPFNFQSRIKAVGIVYQAFRCFHHRKPMPTERVDRGPQQIVQSLWTLFINC